MLQDKFLRNKAQLEFVKKSSEATQIDEKLTYVKDTLLKNAIGLLDQYMRDTSHTKVTKTRSGDIITETDPTHQLLISGQQKVIQKHYKRIETLVKQQAAKAKEVDEAKRKAGADDEQVNNVNKRIKVLHGQIYTEISRIATVRAEHGERQTKSGKVILLSADAYQQQIDQLRVERAKYDAESNWTEYRAEAYKAALEVLDSSKLGEIMTRAKQLELNPTEKVKELLENRDVRYKDYPDVYLVTLQLLFGDDIIGPAKHTEFDRAVKLLPPEKWMAVLQRDFRFALSSVRTDNITFFDPRQAKKLNSTMMQKIVTSFVEDLNKDVLGMPDMGSRIAVDNFRDVAADRTLDFTTAPYKDVIDAMLRDRYFYYYIDVNHLSGLIEGTPPTSLPLPANRTSIKAIAVEYIRRKSFGII